MRFILLGSTIVSLLNFWYNLTNFKNFSSPMVILAIALVTIIVFVSFTKYKSILAIDKIFSCTFGILLVISVQSSTNLLTFENAFYFILFTTFEINFFVKSVKIEFEKDPYKWVTSQKYIVASKLKNLYFFSYTNIFCYSNENDNDIEKLVVPNCRLKVNYSKDYPSGYIVIKTCYYRKTKTYERRGGVLGESFDTFYELNLPEAMQPNF